MNDTKWRKLFAILRRSDLEVTACFWHFLGEDPGHSSAWGIPRADALTQSGVRDSGGFQPVEFWEIRQLVLPATWPVSRGPGLDPFIRSQAIEHVAAALDAEGKFPYALESSRLVIDGYR